MKSLKEDFSLMSSLLIPVAVAINFTGFGLVKLLCKCQYFLIQLEQCLSAL